MNTVRLAGRRRSGLALLRLAQPGFHQPLGEPWPCAGPAQFAGRDRHIQDMSLVLAQPAPDAVGLMRVESVVQAPLPDRAAQADRLGPEGLQ